MWTRFAESNHSRTAESFAIFLFILKWVRKWVGKWTSCPFSRQFFSWWEQFSCQSKPTQLRISRHYSISFTTFITQGLSIGMRAAHCASHGLEWHAVPIIPELLPSGYPVWHCAAKFHPIPSADYQLCRIWVLDPIASQVYSLLISQNSKTWPLFTFSSTVSPVHCLWISRFGRILLLLIFQTIFSMRVSPRQYQNWLTSQL